MAGRACSQPARPVTFGQGCVSSCHVASTKRTCFGENEGREKVGGRSTGSHLGAGSGASELKGFLFFTCLHVFKKKTTKNHPGHCFKMSPCICALAHLYFDLGSTPGRCRVHVGPRSRCCGPSVNHRVRSSSPVGHCCCPPPPSLVATCSWSVAPTSC